MRRSGVSSFRWAGKVDESCQERIVSAIEGATLRAKLLGDAFEAMAVRVVKAVSDVADGFERLYYQAQRVGASATPIRAFEYAVSQLGGTVQGASSSMEEFGKQVRLKPGFETLVASRP
jgi:hypothetical protein